MTTRRAIKTGTLNAVSDSGMRQLILAYKADKRYAAVQEGFEFKPGFIYAQVRAITARINQNYDGWPSAELKKSYRTFLGKPIFVNHQNFDPKKARGKVVAARYKEKGDDRYIETVMEVDAQRFPKLAHEIKTGGMDSVSMGVEAGYTICSHCGNKATDEPEFCDHVKYHKGEKLLNPRTGKREVVHERCYKLGFFELSFVFDPADETALVSRVISAVHHQAQAEQQLIDEIQVGMMPDITMDMPTGMMPTAVRQGANQECPPDQPDCHKGWSGPLADANALAPVSSSNTPGGGNPASSSGGPANQNGLLPGTQHLNDLLSQQYPGANIGGYRVDPSYPDDHPAGKALDFMTKDPNQAKSVMDTAFSNGADYAIWNGQMHYPGGRTTPYSGPNPHNDHVHLHHPGGLSSMAPAAPKAPTAPKTSSVEEIAAKIDKLAFGLGDLGGLVSQGLGAITQPLTQAIKGMGGGMPSMGGGGSNGSLSMPGAPAMPTFSDFLRPGGSSSGSGSSSSSTPATPTKMMRTFFLPNESGGSGGGRSAPSSGPSSSSGFPSSGPSSPGGTGSGAPYQRPDGTWTSNNPAWAHLIDRESGGRPGITQQIHDVNSGGNEAQGLYQITPQTWAGAGGSKYGPNPGQATPQQQWEIAQNILRKNPSGSDWGAGMGGRENANELMRGITGARQTDQQEIAMIKNAQQRLAYGEVEAPEDVDTLRNEDDDTEEFKHYVGSPDELRAPNIDQTKRLDRAQEQEGLDYDRRAEDVEDVVGAPVPSRAARRKRRRAAMLVDPRTGRRYYAADESDSDLIEEAEHDLEMAEDAEDDESDDDDSDSDSGDFGSEDDSDSEDDSEDSEEDDSDDSDSEDDSGSDKPPWLNGKESRRSGKRRTSTQNKRRARKGTPMSLAQRARVAATQQPRPHYADNSGHFDGGPYGEDNQGEQEEIFISQTPSAEGVSAPTPGDGTISNSPNSLVAGLQQRIMARNHEQRRDLIAYEQLTGQRIASPRYAETSVETPDKVNPELSGTNDQSIKSGDWETVGLQDGTTHPTDGGRSASADSSLRAFAAFDNWLSQTTGRTARQHGDPVFLRQAAARFCQASGLQVEAMFPALGVVLREARNNQGATMRRHADEKLEVAAPQDRIDVEKPVSNTTDADAQASQFDLSDFGHNAGDQDADPEMDPKSQIWAPGEGDSTGFKSSSRADGMTAVRYAEAYIRAGLAPNTPESKWRVAGLAQTMRHGTIVDRIRLLDAVNAVAASTTRRTAGMSRGAGRGLPSGLGRRQLTASTAQEAANDQSTDSSLFIK